MRVTIARALWPFHLAVGLGLIGAACGDGITDPQARSVQVTGPATMLVQERVQFEAVAKDASGARIPGRSTSWRSDNLTVATVDQSGLVTGVAGGTALITATIDGVGGTATVTVLPLLPLASCLDDAPTTDPGCNLTDLPSAQSFPAISGSRVVWWDRRFGPASGAIFMYDLATDQLTQITPANTDNLLPAIAGDRIVFVRLPPVVGDWELYWYDVPTRTETMFSTISRDVGLGRFSMSGNRVVWHTRRNDNWDVFLYDFVTRTETRITTHPAEQATPSIHGDIIAWEDRRNGGTWWDIYAYDLATGTERRITAAPTSGRAPVVSADRIVWGDTRGPFPTYLGFSLYEYDVTRVPQERRIPTTPMETS